VLDEKKEIILVCCSGITDTLPLVTEQAFLAAFENSSKNLRTQALVKNNGVSSKTQG